ncbi:MAG: hypothetical protein LK562_01330, partial [Candidatus Accumulibacter phosphatis]|nr:hypothetical protein [Candidatus Accumulibacter phosphatis]
IVRLGIAWVGPETLRQCFNWNHFGHYWPPFWICLRESHDNRRSSVETTPTVTYGNDIGKDFIAIQHLSDGCTVDLIGVRRGRHAAQPNVRLAMDDAPHGAEFV